MQKYSLEIKIPGLPPTTNAYMRKHWTYQAKIARQFKELVIWAVGCKKPKEPMQNARIVITRVSSSEPDFDGLVSSGKHLLDGLVLCRVLVNDKLVRPEYKWQKGPRLDGHVLITVDEL